jgi:hypothetical protein
MNSRTIKFVGLSNRRTIELSDYRTVGPSNRRTIELGLSDYRTVGLSNRRTIDRSPHKTDLILFRIFSFVVAVGVSVGLPVELLMPFFIIQWVGPVLLIVLVFCIFCFCVCFSTSCVLCTNVPCVSGLSILDCPFGFL